MSNFKDLVVPDRFFVGQLLDQQSKIETNIQSILDMSSTHDICHGIAWYQIAHTIAANIAKRHDRSLQTVIGITAALSPGCQWTKNVIDTIAMLEHGSNAIVSTYNANKSKAASIYTGADPDLILGGHKVKSFYQNMMLPEQDRHITIDRHAINASCDWYQQYNSNKFSEDNKYHVLQSAYFAIARTQKMLGNQTQAIVWITYKRIFSTKVDAKIALPDYVYEPNDQWINDANYLSVLEQLRSSNSDIYTQESIAWLS